MEPVRIREDVDPNSPEYRRNLIIVIGILLTLTLVGGSCLGYKIRSAERAKEANSQTGASSQHHQLDESAEPK